MNLLELRLPSLTGSDPETQLLQLRSYLYQLTEQLQLAQIGRAHGYRRAVCL